MISTATREAVRRRAGNRCEYCRLRQEDSQFPHHIEHVIPKQHGGEDDIGNLALACQRCNLNKGPNLAGIDALTGAIAPLFHPRRDRWEEHLFVEGVRIKGHTPTGRATVAVLGMNEDRRLNVRSEIAD